MQRAAVLIGVRQAGTLPTLQAVWRGVERMEAWAASQGIQTVTLTDRDGPVTLSAIWSAIDGLLENDSLEQLLVYFAGHGLNIGQAEYWLLTDAIRNPNEAVNLESSTELARYCGVPHVVIFSDACREAAAGIRQQVMSGGVIFPNEGFDGDERPIDLYFATKLGQSSLEIRDPEEASRTYRAIFTETLVEALDGSMKDLLEPTSDGGLVVRCRPVGDRLLRDVPQRVYALSQRSQEPVARVSSRPEAWLSRFSAIHRVDDIGDSRGPTGWNLEWHGPLSESVPSTSGTRDMPQSTDDGGFENPGGEADPPKPPPDPGSGSGSRPAPIGLQGLSAAALRRALEPTGADPLDLGLEGDEEHPPRGASDDEHETFRDTLDIVVRGFGPDHFETGCGIKIRGAELRSADSAGADLELIPGRTLVRASLTAGPAASVLLALDGPEETGLLVPILNQFLTAVTVADGEVIDVRFEPTRDDDSPRFHEWRDRHEDLQRLRGVVAASTRMGTFRLEDEETAEDLARAMQMVKAFDPALAVYAAYAYRDRGLQRRIERMAEYQRDDLGVVLFDLALLGRRLVGADLGALDDVVPALPLLTQGWSLLPAHGVAFPPGLETISRHVSPSSVWTQYDAEGVGTLRHAIRQGDIR